MELDALDVELAVPQAHDLAVIRRGSGYLQAPGKRASFDHERVIANGTEGVRQALEDSLAVMADVGRLPMAWLRHLNDLPAECLAHRLVPKAHSEKRHLSGEVANERDADARFRWRAWTRRQDDALRCHRFNLFDSQLVVALDDQLQPHLAQVLH